MSYFITYQSHHQNSRIKFIDSLWKFELKILTIFQTKVSWALESAGQAGRLWRSFYKNKELLKKQVLKVSIYTSTETIHVMELRSSALFKRLLRYIQTAFLIKYCKQDSRKYWKIRLHGIFSNNIWKSTKIVRKRK